MKKLFSVLLLLTLALALALSASAAELSSSYSALDYCPDIIGVAPEAEISVTDEGAVRIAATNGWMSNGGVVFGKKVKVDGLKVVVSVEFNLMEDNTVGANCYAAVNLSKTKPTALTLDGIIEGRTAGIDEAHEDGVLFSISRNGQNAAGYILEGDNYNWANSYNAGYTNGSDVTLEFFVGENVITFKANGKTLKDPDGNDVAVDKSVLDADGKAYLSFNAQGYGAASVDFAVKKINGVAANSFTGTSGGTSPDTADIDVVIIAGAMIVALAAAAFVLKARKA